MAHSPERERLWREAVRLVNDALSKGFPFNPGRGVDKSAKGAASKAMGVSHAVLNGYLAAAKRHFDLEPDLSLYQPDGYTTYEEIHAPPRRKPRVRVKVGTVEEPDGPATIVLVIGDAHDAPNIPKDRFRWMGRFAADRKVDHVIAIGDWFTLDSLCHHVDNATFNGRIKGVFLDDILSGKESLSTFDEGLAGYAARKHVTLGNHEERIWKFENQNPEAYGVMSAEFTRILEVHGWTWTRYGQWHFLGGVGFTHAPLNKLSRPYGGKTLSPIANDAVFDVVFGHTHNRNSISVPKLGPHQHVTVLNVGCSLPQGHIEDYASVSLTGWWWGVHVLTIKGGQITDIEAVSMRTLQERYG